MKRICIVGIALVAIGLSALAGMQFKNSVARSTDSAGKHVAAEPRDHVTLTAEKFAAAEITVTTPVRRELRSRRMVPGRIEYNATRHVQVKSPFDGLIRRIDVKVGDRVTEGQVMAIVESPELGERRADVFQRETDFERATNEHDWWHNIQANVDDLVARLKRPQDLMPLDGEETSQLEKDFSDKPLGDYRQQILAAYSRMRLDLKLSTNVKLAAASGAVPGRTKLELDSARDTSRAKFLSVCEQATFDVKQTHIKAESAMKDAERRLAVARQRLGLFVGQPQEAKLDANEESSLSIWPVKAPFTATVEEVLMAPRERIQSAEGLFQLADVSRLWVQADIREKDWSALSISPGKTITVQTPALQGKSLDATVAYVGRAVTLETRAIPLTADIDNREGLLRPGMFVRVLIPDGEPRECLVVPQSSIATNEGRTFVFVETGPREYHPRDVKTGLSVEPWVEVTSGIEPSERIVATGATLLKAELLLEADE